MTTAVLDANVLFPAPLRDYLLHLAEQKLYIPKWTDEIQGEWITSLLTKRKDLSRKSLESARKAMNEAFPDSNIVRYKVAIKTLRLPDEKDRHVLAAAIKAEADCIVTFNTRDFPTSYVKSFGIISKHPDAFVEQLIADHGPQSLKALENQTDRLRNPPKSKAEVLEALKRCGLAKSAVLLESRLS
jgi:predicted nucleic acid-binding protein